MVTGLDQPDRNTKISHLQTALRNTRRLGPLTAASPPVRVFCLAAALVMHCTAAGMGQLLPGGVDRFYSDGYVLVDATGGALHTTTFWGYTNASQAPGDDRIYFHKCVLRTNSMIELITDAYPLNGLIPPLPPYDGSFTFGPVIGDAPFRTSVLVPIPTLLSTTTGDNLTLRWTNSPVPFSLQSSSNLVDWVAVADAPTLVSNHWVLSVSMDPSTSFFRLFYPDCPTAD
jgi:hypothetical protein